MFRNVNHRTNVLVSFFIALAIIIGLVIFILNKDGQQVKQIKLNQPESIKTTKLVIKGVEIQAEIADEPSEISKGLSGRNFLGEDYGMYFDLGKRRVATFWMKGMLFPIDIIWIDDGKIVYVVKNASVPTENNVPTFTSDKPATHVLEVNSGFAKKHNIEVRHKIAK